MERENGTSFLDSSSRTAVFCARLRFSLRNHARPVSYGLILYALAAFWSNSSHADCLGVFICDDALYNATTCFGAGYGSNLSSTNYSVYSGGVPQGQCVGSLPGSTAGLNSWVYRTTQGFQSCNEFSVDDRDCGVGIVVDDPLTFTCPEPGAVLTNVGTGTYECQVPADNCDMAHLDDVTFDQDIFNNPGLCAVGDTVAYNSTNVCTYSESAGEYCLATHYGTLTYSESFPDRLSESGGITFADAVCAGPGTVQGYEFPEDCAQPPPTCPIGEYFDGVSCQLYDDTDGEPVPDPATAERTRTDTITESVVDNGDGTTTTT